MGQNGQSDGVRQRLCQNRNSEPNFILCEGFFVDETKTWMCLICGWIYDELLGAPEQGLEPGTRWADVPLNWTCPECAARKEDFELVQI